MARFELTFEGAKFPVPKRVLIDFFEEHEDLFQQPGYEVHSSVPLEVFEQFVDALKSGKRMKVTKQNAVYVALLAQEFHSEELLAESTALIDVLESKVTAETIAELSERISDLEHKVASRFFTAASTSSPPAAQFSSDSTISRLSQLEANLEKLQTQITERLSTSNSHIDELKAQFEEFRSAMQIQVQSLNKALKTSTPPSPVATPPTSATLAASAPAPQRTSSTPLLPASKPRPSFTFELTDNVSLNGIIAYLTKRFGGNISSKRVIEFWPCDSTCLLNLNTEKSIRLGMNTSVTWNFIKKRVIPTHYTLLGYHGEEYPEAWMIEGSLDDKSWVVLDERKDNYDLEGEYVAWSYPFSKTTECRSIRMSMKKPNHANTGYLVLCAVEFFGTLLD
jgi:hypothetical protein